MILNLKPEENMERIDVDEMISYFKDYQRIDRNIAFDEIRNYQAFIDTFILKEKQWVNLLRDTTPYYNIFEILKIRHYEAKVHTPFLAHLLSDDSSHNQGSLFLDLFFSEILRVDISLNNLSNIEILSERRNDFGQIDIEIWYRDSGIQKAIVIENKIYHHDGEEQLFRYYQYLKHRKVEDENLLIIYLTLHGGSASEQSIGFTPKERIININYRDDIHRWLMVSMEKINPNPVYYTIHQYLKALYSL